MDLIDTCCITMESIVRYGISTSGQDSHSGFWRRYNAHGETLGCLQERARRLQFRGIIYIHSGNKTDQNCRWNRRVLLITQGMMRRFALYPLKKDGTPAAIPRLPPLEELQRSPTNVLSWIDYSTLDTEVTWYLREALQRKYAPLLALANVNIG